MWISTAICSKNSHETTFCNIQIQIFKDRYTRFIIQAGIGISQMLYLNNIIQYVHILQGVAFIESGIRNRRKSGRQNHLFNSLALIEHAISTSFGFQEHAWAKGIG